MLAPIPRPAAERLPHHRRPVRLRAAPAPARDPWRPAARWAAATAAVVVATWTAIGVAIRTRTSWGYFDRSSRLLFGAAPARFGPGGLHLYAAHPAFQFGPATVVAAELVRLASFGHGPAAAAVAIAAMAPAIVGLLVAAARRVAPPSRWTTVASVVGGLAIAAIWIELSVYSLHLDDALTVLLTVVALWAIAAERPWIAGFAIGLAVASKPWAIAFVPVLGAAPTGRRLRSAALALGVAVACWAPFVVADHETLHALSHFTIANQQTSALRRLGVHDARTPRWDRAAQAVVGGAAAWWCARSGRWPAAVAAALAVRIALDPSTHPYYAASVVVAVVAWELLGTRWRVPVVAVLCGLALELPRELGAAPAVAGWIRLVSAALLLAAALAGPQARPPARPRPRCQPGLP